MRASAVPLLLLAGCGAPSADFIEAHGTFADGAALDVHLAAQSLYGAGVQPQLGTVVGVTAAASGPDTLRGLRLEWLPGHVTVGVAQPSAPSGPYIFYVGSPVPNGGTFETQLSVVNGGAITFTENDRHAVGTLANLVLQRRDASGIEQTLVTISSGSFSATNP
jgi:hypothetical protein